MRTLTITQLAAADQGDATPKATVEVRNERGQSATLSVCNDGSRTVIDGAAWLVKSACGDFGSRNVHDAIARVARGDGAETLGA